MEERGHLIFTLSGETSRTIKEMRTRDWQLPVASQPHLGVFLYGPNKQVVTPGRSGTTEGDERSTLKADKIHP